MARACYRMKIDAAADDAAPAMAEINYPISICYAAVDQCSPASLGVPVGEAIRIKQH